LIDEPLLQNKFLKTEDDKTECEITLCPPPFDNDFLQQNKRKFSFPPRLGEHNFEIYKQIGYSSNDMEKLKQDGVI
jgi:crotonobetainyl-CoA:carnitine CoA-transferase CaiB-like acyl-CoA transferase